MSLWPNQVLPGDRPGEASGGNESDLVCPGKKLKNHHICKTKKNKIGQAKWIKSPYSDGLLSKPTKTIQLFLYPVKTTGFAPQNAAKISNLAGGY